MPCICQCPILKLFTRCLTSRLASDIFEEERELARQREELAEKARAEQRAVVLKLIAANFAELKKGRDDFERELSEVHSMCIF